MIIDIKYARNAGRGAREGPSIITVARLLGMGNENASNGLQMHLRLANMIPSI